MKPTGIAAYGYGGQEEKATGAGVARAVSLVNPVGLTTAGAGTLTAALLQAGNLIRRTGPGGAVADTLATAAEMTAAYPEIEAGQSIIVHYANRVAFILTLTASAGMTVVAGSLVAIPANTSVRIVLTKVSATAWTFETC